MITEAIFHVVTAVVNFVLGLMPSMTVPAWVDDAAATIQSGVGPILQLDYWLPIGAVGVVVTFILLAWATALSIRLFRIALSSFTGGGGSAA